MGKFASQLSAYVSFALAFSWFVLLSPTCEWLYTENWLVGFRLNLWKVKITHGLGSILASMASNDFRELFDKLFDESFYLEDAKNRFCAPAFNTVFQWCDVWQRVYWSSMIALFLGSCVVLFHVLGAIFALYYVNEHATHTGRTWTSVSFSMAPILAILNVMQYAFLTWDFGQYRNAILQRESHTAFGMGIILSSFFAILSGIPYFMHVVLSKPDPNEKYGEKDYEAPISGNTVSNGYGTAGFTMPPSMGYGQTPPPNYGQYAVTGGTQVMAQPGMTVHITTRQAAW